MILNVRIVSFTFKIVIVYRIPPSASNGIKKCSFLQDFTDMLENVLPQNGRLIVLGDFNVHWDNKLSAETIELTSILNSFNLTQHVAEPTHIAGHILDLFITRESDDFVTSCQVSDFISDHNALLVNLSYGKPHAIRKNIEYRKIKSIDVDAFSSDVQTGLSYDHETVNEAVYHLQQCVSWCA